MPSNPADVLAGRTVVAGTGLMARGIAAAIAAAGADVLVLGRSFHRADACARDAQALQHETSSHVASGMIVPGLLGETPLDGVRIAVETVLEDRNAKREVLSVLDRDLPVDAVIGSNTAGLPLRELAEPLTSPERLAGWHFMNPAHLTALAEVVPGPMTSEETVDRLCAATLALGKTPIRMRFELPGFVWNRLIFAMWRECDHIVRTGAADRSSVDAAVSDGLAPRWTAGGPFVTMDLGGLDDFARAAREVLPSLSDRVDVPPDLSAAADAGETLYPWTPGWRAETAELRRDALAQGAAIARRRRRIGVE